MSGVCGHEGRCGDWECPYTVCDGCPIADRLDAVGVYKSDSLEHAFKLIDGYEEEDEDA